MAQQVCCDCASLAPEPDADQALVSVSTKYGWRVTRTQGPNGGVVFEWRCSPCWLRYKAERGIGSTPPPHALDAPLARPPSGKYAAAEARRRFGRAVAVLAPSARSR